MTRPPAPGSLAPGLPLPRRPAPRRLLAVIALAVLLIAAADPVSADDQIQIIIDDTNIISETYNHDDALNKDGKALNESYLFSCPPPSLKFMPEITDFKSLVIPTSEMQLYDYNIVNNNTPVVYKMSSSPYTIIGEGDFYYRYDVDTGGGYIVLTADSWTRPSNVGPGSILYGITIEYQEPPNVKKIRVFSTNPVGTFDPTQSQPVIARSSSGNYDYVGETQIVNFERTFRQTVTGSAISADEYRISVERTDPSRIIVKSQKKINAYSDTSGSDNISLTIPYDERPFDISIYSTKNTYKWYNNTILAAGIPIDPADPPAPVTVYAQNSQTGALIANAQLTISAATGDPPALTEVVNKTLPGGTGTFELEKADYLKYHASATADGYTLLSPILFGVPENGTTIILWMAPDAPPDVPIEEGKSMLYGYAMTQGSQQPISGATISLGGYSSTTTSSTGFYLFNNVTPGTYDISASASLHDALSEPVSVDTSPTQHNLALKGHFLLTVFAKDADDLTTLHNTTISLSDGQEAAQNPATFTVDYGPYVVTAAASGYYPTTQSAYVDRPGTTTATVLLTARPPDPTPPEMPNYPPHSVRFLCIDEYNRPLQNVTLRAVYQESTNPVDWFTSWLGLSPSVNINSTTLEGTTGLDGSVIFLMVESVQYRVTVAAPAPINMTKTFDIYPKEDQVTIRFQTRTHTHTPSAMPTYDLTATETDPSSVQLALSYHDATNATTALTFTVTDHATGELIHTETFAASKFPGTVSPTYTVENTKGAMYRFGFEATNTIHGPISQYKGITLNGDGLLVDLGFEDRTLYQWLAVLLLFLFAGAFSGTNVKQGAILVPLFGGGLFWYIGWLPITLGAAISAIGFLGVLVYMRKSEWKVRA